MIDDDPDQTSGDIVEVSEETARVDIREIETGRVRISTATETVTDLQTHDLRGTQIDVGRVKVDRMLEPGEPHPVVRTENGVTIIPVFEEVAVVETRIVLKEEIRITQTETLETVEIPLTLRKQSATIERTEPDE